MGDTKRNHNMMMARYTRSSEMRQHCWAQWFLSNKYDGELPFPGWFALGTGVHLAIEQAVLHDLTMSDAREIAVDHIWEETTKHLDIGMMWTPKRPAEQTLELARFMVNSWFHEVHPDSLNRMPEYEQMEWPPKVEYNIYAEHTAFDYPLYTEADAIFTDKETGEHWIVDWKTGNTPKANALQLHTYSFGLAQSEAWYVRPESQRTGWFHHLAFSKLQKVMGYVGDERIISMIQEVESVKGLGAWQTRPGFLCDYCPAQKICPEVTDDWSVMSGEVEWMEVPLT